MAFGVAFAASWSCSTSNHHFRTLDRIHTCLLHLFSVFHHLLILAPTPSGGLPFSFSCASTRLALSGLERPQERFNWKEFEDMLVDMYLKSVWSRSSSTKTTQFPEIARELALFGNACTFCDIPFRNTRADGLEMVAPADFLRSSLFLRHARLFSLFRGPVTASNSHTLPAMVWQKEKKRTSLQLLLTTSIPRGSSRH